MPLTDIKILKHITLPLDRNLDFESFVDFEHHYQVSPVPHIASMERAYFAMDEYVKHKDGDPKLQMILDMESRLIGVLARMESL